MCPNPYAPTGPTRTANEREDPFERVMKRLADLGAPADGLAEMRKGWNDPDEWADLTENGRPVAEEEGRRRWLAQFDSMTDDQLRELIERAEEAPLIDQLVGRLEDTGELSTDDVAKLREWYEDWHEDDPDEADAEVRRALSQDADGLLAWYREDGEASAEEIGRVPMPEKPVGAVLEWVGEDCERARAALDRELAKPEDERRVTVVAPLQAMLVDDGPTG